MWREMEDGKAGERYVWADIPHREIGSSSLFNSVVKKPTNFYSERQEGKTEVW